MQVVWFSRKSKPIQVVATVVTMLSWIFAQNHCALAGMAPKGAIGQPVGHEHCSGHHSHEKGKGETGLECCKSLQPASVTPAKNLIGYDSQLFALQLFFVAAL